MRHILDAAQFSQDQLSGIFSLAEQIEAWSLTKNESLPNPKFATNRRNWDFFESRPFDYVVATLFTEPSTRTKSSFETAAMRLGGSILPIDFRRSSMEKGETFEDTIRTVSQYADVMVIRHHQEGMVKRAAEVAGVPVINGGDGAGEHPTQSLIDLYTIYKKFGSIDGLKVLFVGDNEKARTVHSLKKMLSKYNCDCSDLKQSQVRQQFEECDVLYVTRFQAERWSSKEQTPEVVVVNSEKAEWMKENSIILHPLPRTQELPEEVDSNHRAFYWNQVKNGIYVRMALLKYVLGHLDW